MRASSKEAAALLLITVSYVISGKAALMLALPPGYASAIFPPAGIAVAAAYIGGRKTLPWIFLGALLLNIWVGYSAAHHVNATGLAAASIIALASTLQAFIGGEVLRRALDYPAAFDKAGEIARFLLLAPLICLVSASLSVGGLAWLGVFDRNSLAVNWLSWWIGDALGVLVMLPIVMTLAGEPHALWRSRLKTVALPMLLVLALFVAMFLKANKWEQEESLSDFRQISEQVLGQIRMGLDEQSTLLMQFHGLFIHDVRDTVTRDEFRRYCEGTLNKFPMIQAMEWVPRITSAERAEFETAQRSEVPGFGVTERGASGQIRRAGKRSEYYPVTYIEPLSGNEPALGFDLASNPKRKAALDKAFATGLPVATAPIRLVQGGAGILIIQPVTISGRNIGVVLTVLKLNDFITQILPPTSSTLEIRLLDEDGPETLYDSFSGNPPQVISGHTFDYGTRHYRLLATPTTAYYRQHRSWQSWGVLAMGTFGTSLLGALLLLGTGYTARVEVQVRERTDELKESEERFRKTLEHSPIGMCIGSLEGGFLQTNQAYCIIVGYTKDELARMNVREITHPDDVSSDMEYRQRLLNGKIDTYSLEKRYLRKDGHVVWVQVTVSLERDTGGAPEHFIVQVEDISDRKASADLLRKSEEEYRDLYDNAPCGYHSLDRDGLYVMINNTELDWLGCMRADVIGKKGCIDFLTPESRQALLQSFSELMKKGKVEGIGLDVICKDGDIKHVMASATAVYDANGDFLMSRSVLTDITAQKKMERMIEDKVLELQTILDGSSVAITFVRDRRQIWTNKRMGELFGYSAAEMANQPTRMFYRSQADFDAFGEQAYPVLQQGEVFQTELEMRHHDGHSIWINISGKAIVPADLSHGSIWVLEDITERKRAERALQESRELLQLFIDNAPAALAMFDRDMRYLSASRRWRTDYGLGEQDLGGRSHYEIFPEIPERWKALHRRGMNGEVLRATEDRFEREDGSVMWLRWEIWPWHKGDGSVGGIVLVTEDITERKHIQDALLDSAREIEDLYENAPCGYHSIDESGRIIKINQTELDWLGYSRDELLGRNIGEIHTEASQPQFQEKLARLTRNQPIHDMEFDLIRKDGTILPVLLNATAIFDQDGKFVMSRSTILDMRDRKELEHRLEMQAHTDPLTGLSNRGYFYELAEREFARARRLHSPLGLLVLDIDHFKQFNDTHGHDAGDEVLKAFSACSLQTLREIDVPARWGGEEFVVLLPGVGEHQAMEAAERLRVALSNAPVATATGETLSFTVSIGVTTVRDPSEHIDAAIKRADNALYAAKHAGRNCVRYE